ncbi:hypothetical protein [Tellurirhabdus rosea]|uniref:hypothetical protein n=1 Tax=Tellurirhabdus rosea TaxID=2674997 RepID=UPI00225B9143|nr:hypothetical protein [Tellurirhabdus rosea]
MEKSNISEYNGRQAWCPVLLRKSQTHPHWQIGQQLFGNYVSIQLARPVSYYVSEKSFDASTQTFITRRTAPTLQGLNLPTLGLFWGLQRRLSHFGYVDLNAGPQLMRPQDTKSTRLIDFSFQFNAAIGLGW